MNSYVIWNNKGGVGKSTIAFNLAVRFAEKNPNRKILILDMCPQANLTMTLLGGGTTGERHLLALQASSTTIAGHVSDTISRLAGQNPQARSYHIAVHSYHNRLPKNVWLVPGDGNLELIAPAISYYANAAMPLNAWHSVHLWVQRLVQEITNDGDDWTVFIDTNPSFSIYTELALLAGTRLIVPYKADDSSRLATKALFALLYGANPPHPVYSQFTFAARARQYGVALPKCYLFVGNQFTQFLGTSMAFRGLSDAVTEELYQLYLAAPSRYVDRGPIRNDADFKQKFVYELRDFNSAGVVAAHQGRLLSDLKETFYDVHGTQVQLSRARINECAQAVDSIVRIL